MVGISLKQLKVNFDEFTALHNIDVSIEEGKITTLLGPSGCGKTTTLRSIAGFNKIAEGDIFFDEKEVTDLPPQKRDSGFVFQNYALWPHMSVFDNIGYGLKLRDVESDELKERVKKVAEMVNISDQLLKKPSDLSGGQQQRVALARALVIEPSVLLCDEPLSNLDAKLRLEMRIQVRRIVNELGLTCIWVTHDQEEALSLSDNIVVMDAGVIMQAGDPIAIYTDPANLFVAEFMGEHSKILVKVIDTKSKKVETAYGQTFTLPLKDELKDGDDLSLILRPEHLTLEATDDMIKFTGEIVASAYMGRTTRLQLKLSKNSILHFDKAGEPEGQNIGDNSMAGILAEDILVFSSQNRVR